MTNLYLLEHQRQLAVRLALAAMLYFSDEIHLDASYTLSIYPIHKGP